MSVYELDPESGVIEFGIWHVQNEILEFERPLLVHIRVGELVKSACERSLTEVFLLDHKASAALCQSQQIIDVVAQQWDTLLSRFRLQKS